MLRVLVSDSLSEQGLAILRADSNLTIDYQPGLGEDALAAALPGAHALVIRSGSKVTARVIEAATTLRVIGRAGIGVDNVDVPAASKRGIVVMNTPTGNAVTTAEHAISLLFSLARMIPQAAASMKAGQWEKKKFEGRELAGKTLGVVGLGNIGRIVADRAKGLRMNVIGFDPVLTADRAAALGIELCGLDAIWARADAITVHTPLTATTQNLVDDAVVARLKKGVLLINAARGGIYDLDALLRGLESGHIGGVALDVFTTEPPPKDLAILQHERVIATPHLGASTKEAQARVALEIAEQVVSYLATGAVKNAVNAPSVAGEVAPKLAPYLDLADKLGGFLASVSMGPQAASTSGATASAHVEPSASITAIEVECGGEPADLGMKAIVASAVAGYLRRYLDAPVNQVSAPHVAAERGIEVRELRRLSPQGKHASLVILRVHTAEGAVQVAQGALGSDGSARLVAWNDFEIEAHLGGHTLVVTNIDKPGVIGMIGTALGNVGVNIAGVHLGVAGTGDAVSVWSLDSAIPAGVLAELRLSPNVSSAIPIRV
jgi:D-3-phosphoglycerate dehydrogenase